MAIQTKTSNESNPAVPPPPAPAQPVEALTLSSRAADRLQAILRSENKEGYALRMSVVGGGCSGLSYNMSFDNEQKEFDKVFQSQGLTIYCDLKSWLYLRGTEIDFSDDILTGGFKLNNPNATRTCGCGTSFSA